MKHLFYLPLLLLFSACAFVACGDDENDFWGAGGSSNPQPVLPATGAEQHRLEVPEMLPGNDFIAHYDGNVMTYCLEYDRSKWHSRWVAFRFDGSTRRDPNVSRKDYGIRPQYPADPKLPTEVAIPSDASFNGYDHGHLCASADRLYSRTANDQTFYMTNMSPMNGNFNQGYWVALEGLVQSLGRNVNSSDTLYVVKGGTIQDGMFSNRVASSRIVVPKYYYMALLRYRGGTYSAIAFWMEHKDYGYNKDFKAPQPIMRQHAVSVDELEEKTDINFFHNLPDAVEVQVERQCAPSEWGM